MAVRARLGALGRGSPRQPTGGGAQGPQGPQGDAGGPQGPTGATGPQGTQGTQGVAGAQGPQGDDGTAGVQGATGPQGTQGVAGAQGPQGDDGTAGATGPAGDAGWSVYEERFVSDTYDKWITLTPPAGTIPAGSMVICEVTTITETPSTLIMSKWLLGNKYYDDNTPGTAANCLSTFTIKSGTPEVTGAVFEPSGSDLIVRLSIGTSGYAVFTQIRYRYSLAP